MDNVGDIGKGLGDTSDGEDGGGDSQEWRMDMIDDRKRKRYLVQGNDPEWDDDPKRYTSKEEKSMTTISKHSVITINTKDKEYEYDMAFISCEGLSYEGLEVFVKHNHPDWTSFVLVVVNQG